MTLTCASCDRPCLRTGCHRNRYNELICHECQSDGVRFTWRSRAHYHWRMVTFGFWIMLGCSALVLLAAWAIHMLTMVPPTWMTNG